MFRITLARAFIAISAASFFVPSGALARVTGTAGATWAQGAGVIQIEFACQIANGITGPCSGDYTATVKEVDCSNSFRLAGSVVFSGFNLSRAGSFEGSVNFSLNDYDYTRNPNGSCVFVPGSIVGAGVPYSATWDGTRGTITTPQQTDQFGNRYQVTGTFSASTRLPVFPMAVTANIDSAIANVSAVIQYRPQDIGTTGRVFVFAVAPANLVRPSPSAAEPLVVGRAVSQDGSKEDAPACVLAQMGASGQLQQASTSSLQTYVSGVLSAQGQSVTILNGVSTPSVAGATFYVGYGPSSTTMINDGVNRSAITVPGAVECKPQAPQTGWWWNPAEGGRGFSIESSGNKLFMAAYLYDASGRASWLVSSGPTSLDGSLFTGDLLGCSGGQTLGGPYPGFPHCTSSGTVTLAFSNASHGTLVWPGGSIPIERFNIVTGGLTAPPQASQPENGWWWNAAEDGRGFFVEWQAGWADLAGYMYDEAGNAVWYISVFPTPNARTFSGNWWQYGNGQTLTGTYQPATRVNDNVAPVTVQFSGPDTGIMTLPNGRTTAITRYRF